MYKFIGGSNSNDDTHTYDKKDIGNKIVMELLSLKNQIKIFHWQTSNYAEHKALDKLFNILSEQNDRWVETFMGKYGRILVTSDNNQIILYNTSKRHGIISYLKEWVNKMLEIKKNFFSDPIDGDLSNIFDEIFGDINKTCYLLSLK